MEIFFLWGKYNLVIIISWDLEADHKIFTTLYVLYADASYAGHLAVAQFDSDGEIQKFKEFNSGIWKETNMVGEMVMENICSLELEI